MDRKRGRMYYSSPMRHFKRYYEHIGVDGQTDEKLKSLEGDLKEISEEITNMVGNMDNSEKQMLRSKLTLIAQKI
ncbi:MAG: hypothetical protein MJ091_06130 [Clostridia bacterium]|nr:hypothetical protein [Clostridia bacterium]